MISVLTQRALKLAMMNVIKGRKRLLGEKLPKPDIYYFGYGANLDLERFTKYQMNVEPVGVARLDDHALKFSLPCEYLGKGFASVDPEPGKTVWGYLYKIDHASLLLLDIMEWAVLNQYHRSSVRIQTLDGVTVNGYTYVARYPREGLVPSDAYKQQMVESARQHAFPDEYIRQIESSASRATFDLDPGFSLLFPPKRRFFEKQLKRLYVIHDKVRERMCEKLRF